MVTAYRRISNQQRAWANKRGIELNEKGYTPRLNDNLFCPLSPKSELEFRSGRGDELSKGKMNALHSSSALVVNVFEYWRDRDVDFIAQACGASKGATSLHFERTYPTGLGSIPPHLDVEFYNPLFRPLAVEAKFTESYRRKTKRHIKEKYLNSSLWKGLSGCESLVRRIREEEKGTTSFSFLDAPQLLKHILGLTTKFGKRGFELLYLWYDCRPSLEAERHRREIGEFERYISSEVSFQQMAYQELFKSIRDNSEADPQYIGYLADRYFYDL